MLPAVAYKANPATSLAIKYVHTSTNKIKHPVNVVKVPLTWPSLMTVDTGRQAAPNGFQ
jgi:hypothetical protein